MSVSETNKEISVTKLLFISATCLVLGHLLLQQYMPNIAAGAIGYISLLSILGYLLFYRSDLFGFVLVTYICSHFSYGDGHGGLWNIIACNMLLFYLLSGRNRPEMPQQDITIKILLATFVFFNFAGWIFKNPMPIAPLLKGIVAFSGYILMYLVASKMQITPARIKAFLSITFFLLLYQVAVSLIQYYQLTDAGTPLVGGTTLGQERTAWSHEPRGTIGHFELSSEYSLLMISLCVPLLSSSTTRNEIKFNYTALPIMIFACVSIIIITSMRGAFILSILVTAFCYLIFAIRVISAFDKVTQQIKIVLLMALLLPAVGVYLGMKELEKDFSRLDTQKMTVESVASGKSINRGGLAEFALRRMESESWIVGFGSGTISSNKWAWFGDDPEKGKVRIADFHNLYVSLPMIYGWTGSLAFVGIILVTFFRLILITLKYRRKKSYLVVLSFGLTVMWGAFIIHEYKISILRNANYQMLFWIWLGISASLVKTMKQKWQVTQAANYQLNRPLGKNIKGAALGVKTSAGHQNLA